MISFSLGTLASSQAILCYGDFELLKGLVFSKSRLPSFLNRNTTVFLYRMYTFFDLIAVS